MSLRKNVIANYLGQGWTSLIGLAVVPLYIEYLGIEAFGLIGIFALIQGWLTLLDMGMTPTLNREIARFSAGAHTPQSIRNLLRSLEIICLCIASLIGLSIWLTSVWLATDWLRPDKLPIDTVAQAIAIMGGVAALRFLEGIYRGAILGLQRQVFFNIITASIATIRALGAVAVLAWVSPTIEAYFVWQGLISGLSVAILAISTYSCLPAAPKPARFSRSALLEIRTFIGGVMATTFLALLLTQVDKILLSRLLTLEEFGYYMLAATIASATTLLIAPVSQAFYPRFSELVALKNGKELVLAYHRSAQLVSALATPVVVMLVFFGADILVLWTGNPVLAEEVGPLLALLALGSFMNGLLYIPYMLQLAHGWTGLAARLNLATVILLLPAIVWATNIYGSVGAASVWVLLNAGYILVSAHFMHKRLLPGEKWKWYLRDTLVPILAGTTGAAFFSLAQPIGIGNFATLLWLIVSAGVIFLFTLLAIPDARNLLAKILSRQHW